MNKKTIEDIDVSGKRVLVRCDFNVPLDGTKITDETRIVAALPTIKYLLDHNAAVILCSHLGRPKGEFNMKYSLAPVAERLSELLDKKVVLAKDVIGPDAQKRGLRAEARRRGSSGERPLPQGRGKERSRVCQEAWLLSLKSMSTMLSAPRTARMLPPPALPTICPPLPAILIRQGDRRHGQGALAEPEPVPLWRSWAALRFPIRSASSPTCWRRSIP